MKIASLDNKFDTDKVSRIVRLRMARKQTAESRNEECFLADQATDARTALMQTVREMKQTLTQAADVRTCARQHPWIATGSAVAVGFVAGAVVSRPRSTSGNRSPAVTDAAAPPDSADHNPARAQPGFLRATLGRLLAGFVQSVLQKFIAAAVVGTETEAAAEERLTPCGSPPSATPESATS